MVNVIRVGTAVLQVLLGPDTSLPVHVCVHACACRSYLCVCVIPAQSLTQRVCIAQRFQPPFYMLALTVEGLEREKQTR